LHSIGELDPERRFIMHFLHELSIESFGSGYGGNALLGKKCHGLSTGKLVVDWQRRPYDPARGPAAHPNARFTVSAR
jgi:phosphoenolpyruvate carboxykinase (GTP)